MELLCAVPGLLKLLPFDIGLLARFQIQDSECPEQLSQQMSKDDQDQGDLYETTLQSEDAYHSEAMSSCASIASEFYELYEC